MLIAWKGRGWLVGVVSAGCLLASDFLTGLYYKDPNHYAQHGWPKLGACWVSAAVVFTLNPNREETLGVAVAADQRRTVLQEGDSFCYIPVRYWPPVLMLVGILLYFVRD